MNDQNFGIFGGPIEDSKPVPPNNRPTENPMKPTKLEAEIQDLSILGGPVAQEDLKNFFEDFESNIHIESYSLNQKNSQVSNRLFFWSFFFLIFLIFFNFSIEFYQYSLQLSKWNGYLSIVALSGLTLGLVQWIHRDLRSIKQLKSSYQLRLEASNLYRSLSDGSKVPLSQVRHYFFKLNQNWSSPLSYSKNRLDDLLKEIDLRIQNKVQVDPMIYLKQLDQEVLYDIDQSVKSSIHKKVLRCAISTGVSNIAIVDVCFFLLIYLSMVKDICQHYGYKPGPIGTLWILKNIGTGALLASSTQTLLN
ncbi:DUF697 domain-containing protein, partial [bacterium]|nr:DUF697 domain-containing protein [bacterium]